MQAAIAPRGDARTYLLHFTGGGLDDDRYVIQRFVSRSDGEIVAVEEAASGGKGRRRSRGTLAQRPTGPAGLQASVVSSTQIDSP